MTNEIQSDNERHGAMLKAINEGRVVTDSSEGGDLLRDMILYQFVNEGSRSEVVCDALESIDWIQWNPYPGFWVFTANGYERAKVLGWL